MTTKHKIYTMSFAKVYPCYVAKAEKKGRTKEEVDEIIRWLTGYSQEELDAHIEQETESTSQWSGVFIYSALYRSRANLLCSC